MAAGQLVHGAAGIPLRRLPAESGKEPALLPGGDHDHGTVPGAGKGRAGPGDGGALRRLSGGLSIGDGAGPAGAGAVPRRPALRHHRRHRRCVPQTPLRLRHGGLRPGLRAAVHFPAAVRGAGHGEAAAPGRPQRADSGGGPGLWKDGQRYPAGIPEKAGKAGQTAGHGGTRAGRQAGEEGRGRGPACGLLSVQTAQPLPGGALYRAEPSAAPGGQPVHRLPAGQPGGGHPAVSAGVAAGKELRGPDPAAHREAPAPAPAGHGGRRSGRGEEPLRHLHHPGRQRGGAAGGAAALLPQ